MPTTSPNTCLNCNTQNDVPFKYCFNCGQKHTDGKITFAELWTEFKDAAFNIDSRTWRTFKHLFIPGKLTLEYFAGKHRQYVHPLRLLLVSSVLLIMAMSFQNFDSTTNHRYNVREWILQNYERQQMYRILGNIADTTNAIFSDQQTALITDTIMSSFKDSLLSFHAGYKYRDRYGNYVDINKYASFGSEGEELIVKGDFIKMTEEELVAKYKKDAGYLEQLTFRQKIKVIKDESRIFAGMVGRITWAALLMMPCLALVLYLLNIRNGYYYIEHLIFTFHIHAFAFIVIALFILGINIIPWWIFSVFLAIIGIYVFASMLKVYRQSLVKTMIKFFVLSILYTGLLALFFFGTILFTLMLL